MVEADISDGVIVNGWLVEPDRVTNTRNGESFELDGDNFYSVLAHVPNDVVSVLETL